MSRYVNVCTINASYSLYFESRIDSDVVKVSVYTCKLANLILARFNTVFNVKLAYNNLFLNEKNRLFKLYITLYIHRQTITNNWK